MAKTSDYDPLMDELPPELAAEYRAEQRKRKMAEAMLGQSMQPLQAPEVKGRFQGAISPFQGLAQVAQAYMAHSMLIAPSCEQTIPRQGIGCFQT